MLAVVGLADGLGIVVIEAKVDEGFDRLVAEWLAVPSKGKTARLTKLCSLLGIDPADTCLLRYQLLHRTASAIIEARRYRSNRAAMVIQSWSSMRDGFEDYCAFFDRIDCQA